MHCPERDGEEIGQSTNTPKYLTLYEVIKKKIDDQEWMDNQEIPTERELAELYQSSRTTVRKAIGYLRQKGYVHSEHGRGTFVLPERSRRAQHSLHSFTDDIRSRGGKAGQEILEMGFIKLNEMIRNSLELPINQKKIFRIKRLRFSDTTPMGIQTAYLPLKEVQAFSEEELIKYGSLYTLLSQKINIVPLEAYESISARLPSPMESRLLELSTGDVVLSCTRVTLSTERKPMEYVEMIYPANRYSYEIKITKDSFNHK